MTKQEYNRQVDMIIQAYKAGVISDTDARVHLNNLTAEYIRTVK